MILGHRFVQGNTGIKNPYLFHRGIKALEKTGLLPTPKKDAGWKELARQALSNAEVAVSAKDATAASKILMLAERYSLLYPNHTSRFKKMLGDRVFEGTPGTLTPFGHAFISMEADTPAWREGVIRMLAGRILPSPLEEADCPRYSPFSHLCGVMLELTHRVRNEERTITTIEMALIVQLTGGLLVSDIVDRLLTFRENRKSLTPLEIPQFEYESYKEASRITGVASNTLVGDAFINFDYAIATGLFIRGPGTHRTLAIAPSVEDHITDLVSMPVLKDGFEILELASHGMPLPWDSCDRASIPDPPQSQTTSRKSIYIGDPHTSESKETKSNTRIIWNNEIRHDLENPTSASVLEDACMKAIASILGKGFRGLVLATGNGEEKEDKKNERNPPDPSKTRTRSSSGIQEPVAGGPWFKAEPYYLLVSSCCETGASQAGDPVASLRRRMAEQAPVSVGGPVGLFIASHLDMNAAEALIRSTWWTPDGIRMMVPCVPITSHQLSRIAQACAMTSLGTNLLASFISNALAASACNDALSWITTIGRLVDALSPSHATRTTSSRKVAPVVTELSFATHR
jgi:AlwI restriction endonuclease